MPSTLFSHGGNLSRIAAMGGQPIEKVLDFSASINPLGMPPAAREAIVAGIERVAHYPEPLAGQLVAAISAAYKLASDRVLAGNGSTELLYLALRVLRPRKVLLAAPGFNEYHRAAALVGAKVKWLKLRERTGFQVEPHRFIAAMDGCDLALLCNPNNPTGHALNYEQMSQIAAAAKALGCYLLVDEAFADFTPEISLLGRAQNSRLLILRSLTKFYAMPGLRLGFIQLPRALHRRFLAQKEPWSVNTLAEFAACAALADHDFARRSREFIATERAWLESRLARLPHLKLYPAAANYLMLDSPQAPQLVHDLLHQGIAVRHCANFRGLSPHFIRIAVRTRAENQRLLTALEQRNRSPEPTT